MSHEPRVVRTIDGIEEYDNPLPGWWLTLFYGAIVFAVIYWVLFPSWLGAGLLKWSQAGQYDREVKEAAKLAPRTNLARMLRDPAAIAAGKAVFAANCVACHGANAEGGIGPNLHHPPYWAYGKGSPEDLEFVVNHGTTGVAGLNKAAKGGMPAWTSLGSLKVDEAVAYLYHLEHEAAEGEAPSQPATP